MKKSTKTAKTPAPQCETVGTYLPEGMAEIRRMIPRCQEAAAALSEAAAISALDNYSELDPGPEEKAAQAAYGAALDAVTPALSADALEAALTTLDCAHGDSLRTTGDAAFLTGYYAGMAAGKAVTR